VPRSSGMSRKPAKFTQSDVSRVLNAARKLGVDVQIELRNDGTILVTTGKTGNQAAEPNEWDEINGGNKTETRQ
jgi:hypothetical protein